MRFVSTTRAFRACAFVLALIASPAGAAFAADIPLDAGGLPLWEPAVFTDFPVWLVLADGAELAALLARVPIASFEREQLRVVRETPLGGHLVFTPRVTESELRALEAAGYAPARLPDLERRTQEEIEARWLEQVRAGGERLRRGDRGVYHTYSQLGQIMSDAAADHPAIARFDTIGFSVQGRALFRLHISDNPDVEEAEPEARISACLHGNEKVAMEMAVYLLDYLTDNYGVAGHEDVTGLVNDYDIWLQPLSNPDGHASNSRYNAHGVDLNRNFPVPDGSIGDDGTWDEEPEVVALKAWISSSHPAIGQNGHSGALVVNYPWDYTYTLAPDDAAFIRHSEEFSYYNPPMWNGDWYHGITNGAQWYVIKGGLQDYAYHTTGSMDVTIEFSDSYQPSASQLDAYWDNNRESFKHWIQAARYGVNGRVTSAATGLPLAATVSAAGIGKSVVTDPACGDYYKLLDTGSYTLTFSAHGYETVTVPGVGTVWGTPTVLDVALPLEGTPVAEAPVAAAPLLSARPNPFNPATTLRVSLAQAGPLRLDILDAQGRLMRRLLDTELAAGGHAVVWDGRDGAGRSLPSGVYLARAAAGGARASTRLVLLK